jgi:hypothetical protein
MYAYIHLEAHKRTWLNNMDNEHQINWGTLRCNLDFMEVQMNIQGNYMEHTIPTWRYCALPFPNCTIVEDGEDSMQLKIHTGFKYSLDIKITEGMDAWVVGQMVQAVIENPDFKLHFANNTSLNPRNRKSNANQGRLDWIEAQPNWPNFVGQACTYV